MKRTILALAATSMFLVAGCGSDDEATPTSSSTPLTGVTMVTPESSTTSTRTSDAAPTSTPEEQAPAQVPTTADSGPKNQSDTSGDSSISSSLINEGGVCYDFEVDMESDGLTCTVTDADGTSRWTP